MEHRKHFVRPGVNLVELVVVLGILALMVGLLLPAVQGVREEAARTQSANQLRQIGLAYHHWCDPTTQRSMPTGTDAGYGSVFTNLLPYLEQPELAHGHPIPGAGGQPNQSLRIVRNYMNTSDPSYAERSRRDAQDPGGDCSYAVNSLVRRLPVQGLTIPDGASQTILFSERYSQCKTVRVLWSTSGSKCYDMSSGTAVEVTCALASLTARRATFSDASYADEYLPFRDPGTGQTIAPSPGVMFQSRPKLDECDYRTVQGVSPRGLTVCLGDASVRLLTKGMSADVYWSAVTPAGHEVLGAW
jgi:hypothetical protein